MGMCRMGGIASLFAIFPQENLGSSSFILYIHFSLALPLTISTVSDHYKNRTNRAV